MTSSTTSTLRPEHFYDARVSVANRDLWTREAMSAVSEALDGAPVIVTTDQRTGYTLVNVTLGGVRQTPGYGTFQVLINYEHAPGEFQGIWTSLSKIGHIVAMQDPGALGVKYQAVMRHLDLIKERDTKLAAAK